jgi:hypothetical protein
MARRDAEADFAVGPPSASSAKHFSRQANESARQEQGAVIVTEHYASDPPELTAITVRLKRQPGFNARHDDWYWVHFTPTGGRSKQRPTRIPGRSAVSSRSKKKAACGFSRPIAWNCPST